MDEERENVPDRDIMNEYGLGRLASYDRPELLEEDVKPDYLTRNKSERLRLQGLLLSKMSRPPSRLDVDERVLDAPVTRGEAFALWMVNEGRRRIFFGVFLIVQTLVFVLGFVNYAYSDNFDNARATFHITYPIARAAALTLHFDLALILLPVCRNMISFLRNTPLGAVIPFDSNITFHKAVAWSMVFFTAVHVTAHMVNFAQLGIASGTNVVGFLGANFATGPGITGWIMTLALAVMVWTAIEKNRRANFERFWYAHHLGLVFFLMWSIHGMFCMIQPDRPPYCSASSIGIFWRYWLVGGTIYSYERILRELRSRHKTYITKVIQHPSNVVEIQFQREGAVSRPGQYIFLNCPAISLWQWHPFTLTSAPEHGYLSVHIRMVGDFTRALGEALGCDLEGDKGGAAKAGSQEIQVTNKQVLPRIMIDGPFGSSSEDYRKFDTVVLVGAGIGITPFASILSSIWYQKNEARRRGKKTRLTKVYFFWICRDTTTLSWFQNLLSAIEDQDDEGYVEIHTYVTQRLKEAELNNLMIADVGSERDSITGLKAPTHFGRPNWSAIFQSLQHRHPSTEVGVFFCGPKPLGSALHLLGNFACSDTIMDKLRKRSWLRPVKSKNALQGATDAVSTASQISVEVSHQQTSARERSWPSLSIRATLDSRFMSSRASSIPQATSPSYMGSDAHSLSTLTSSCRPEPRYLVAGEIPRPTLVIEDVQLFDVCNASPAYDDAREDQDSVASPASVLGRQSTVCLRRMGIDTDAESGADPDLKRFSFPLPASTSVGSRASLVKEPAGSRVLTPASSPAVASPSSRSPQSRSPTGYGPSSALARRPSTSAALSLMPKHPTTEYLADQLNSKQEYASSESAMTEPRRPSSPAPLGRADQVLIPARRDSVDSAEEALRDLNLTSTDETVSRPVAFSYGPTRPVRTKQSPDLSTQWRRVDELTAARSSDPSKSPQKPSGREHTLRSPASADNIVQIHRDPALASSGNRLSKSGVSINSTSTESLSMWPRTDSFPATLHREAMHDRSDLPANMPEWSRLQADEPTSYPNNKIVRDLDFAMRKLLSEAVFKDFLEDPLARWRFREYLKTTRGDPPYLLDCWWDAELFARQFRALRQGAHDFGQLYLQPTVAISDKVGVSSDKMSDASLVLDSIATASNPVARIQDDMLRTMFKTDFQSFVKTRLVEQARVKLGSFTLRDKEKGQGLGDCFVITNPRQRDHPIIGASDAFVELTGYSRQAICSRNCRFLQGPSTSREAVARIRVALNTGQACTELLLNYRQNGQPFFNLLCIFPLRDTDGSVSYYCGGQINVSGPLKSSKSLRFLVGIEDEEPNGAGSEVEPSPTMSQYLTHKRSNLESPAQCNPLFPSAAGYQPSSAELSRHTSARSAIVLDSLANGKEPQQTPGPGAEQQFRVKEAKGIDEASREFESVYSKAIFLEPHRCKILFATEPFLEYLGLPTSTAKERFNSAVLRQDLTDLLHSPKPEGTKRLRDQVRAAIAEGQAFSVLTDIKISSTSLSHIIPRKKTLARQRGMLHATPIKDTSGSIFAFVALFGTD
ncbi:hypothetical protein E5Q_01178 [Mixia osmundae IAM 14324]|uniref:FAD-binding FR-type domain-containing protein n=1 Tax=Mixia osmundae (strain CBS 9802 / IAM 14324 / JCM 22182 / KY 12970) TaxID=764103 RepID=G7DVB6_MIXOS|nr:hypothetical protein E5Q_01178 [Mixia osmundae IAM 14324]